MIDNPDEEVDGGADEGERMPGDEAHLARDDDPPHPEADEAEGEGEETSDEEADDNPLHVLVKENHADELVDLLSRYGYTELAEAFRSAEVGEVIEVKVVED